MRKFINPFTDIGFKKIFGQEVSKDLLIDFLNNLLKGERVINDVRFLDKEQIGFYDDDRSLIYDVLCETPGGERIIVEMQNRSQPYYKRRSIYYAAQAVVRQGERGKGWQYDVKAVYCISFLNFQQNDISERFRVDVTLMDMETKQSFSELLRLIYLQLPLFTKDYTECENDFERWICVLKDMDIMNRLPEAAKNSVFKKVAEIGELSSLTYEERLKYDDVLKRYRDTLAVMEGQKQEGFREGMEKGIEKGMEKGKAEIARNLKNDGIPLDVIARNTGLSIEEIEKL
ncbi:MAG: Rpn family recombination-promoting nuclease/putative transposase [Prevotella sp.]|nr:Rpn family recombination-promoting nuclease/putative transposase [Prevotella sp.]